MWAAVLFYTFVIYRRCPCCLTIIRGGRYYRKKSSTADISEFFKLSANYRYWILGLWELSKNYRYRKLHTILSDIHNWKHCSKNKKGPRWSTEKLLVARDFWCSKANTDSINVCEKCTNGARYKICCEKHNSWTCQTKICGGFAIELKRILWNKDSDSGSTGFVFESICAKLVLYDFWCNRCLFNVFQCLYNVILCLLNPIFAFFMQFCAFLTPFPPF